jgi:Na+/proline symporter
LHPVFFGIVVASIFAAIISTADSQLLVSTSSVVRDFYEKILHAGATIPQQRLVRYSRAVVVVLVAAAVGFGLIAEKIGVFWLVLLAWAGLGASFGPTSILALYWRRTTRAGVIAGLVTGALVTIVWDRVPALNSLLYELIPAFTAGLLVTAVVSCFTRPPEGVARMFESMGERRGAVSRER